MAPHPAAGPDRFAAIPQQPLVEAAASAHVLEDQNAAVVGEAERAGVEGIVVEGADAEAVVGGVGAARGVQAYVGDLEGEAGVVEHGIPAADGAAVLVDAEDHGPESGVTWSPGRHLDLSWATAAP